VLVVDEYQDLGHALQAWVMALCLGIGIRLFAGGNADQSVYGFTGANPELSGAYRSSKTPSIRLRFNYRCGSRIVTASQHALGEPRYYLAPDVSEEGTIYFHPRDGNYAQQADFVFGTLIPSALARIPGLTPRRSAVTYPAAWSGRASSGSRRRRATAEAHGQRGHRVLCETDADAGAIILTGAGERAFSRETRGQIVAILMR